MAVRIEDGVTEPIGDEPGPRLPRGFGRIVVAILLLVFILASYVWFALTHLDRGADRQAGMPGTLDPRRLAPGFTPNAR